MEEMQQREAEYKAAILREAGEQWGNGAPYGGARDAVLERLFMVSWLAHIELARNLRPVELEQLATYGRQVGSRSTKPRVVLRKIIELAGVREGWVPTPMVLKAAGLRRPQ